MLAVAVVLSTFLLCLQWRLGDAVGERERGRSASSAAHSADGVRKAVEVRARLAAVRDAIGRLSHELDGLLVESAAADKRVAKHEEALKVSVDAAWNIEEAKGSSGTPSPLQASLGQAAADESATEAEAWTAVVVVDEEEVHVKCRFPFYSVDPASYKHAPHTGCVSLKDHMVAVREAVKARRGTPDDFQKFLEEQVHGDITGPSGLNLSLTYCATEVDYATGAAKVLYPCSAPPHPVHIGSKTGGGHSSVCDCGFVRLRGADDARVTCATTCRVGLRSNTALRAMQTAFAVESADRDADEGSISVAATQPSGDLRGKWRAHREARALRERTEELFKSLVDSFREHRPRDENDTSVLKTYRPPMWEAVKRHYAGEGIVFCTGGLRLSAALAVAVFIRKELRSVLPMEIWRSADELPPTPQMIERCEALDIFFRVFPDEFGFGVFTWGDRWRRWEDHPKDDKDPIHDSGWFHVLSDRAGYVALKPYAALASSFDRVIFFDDDALPLADPVLLLQLLGDKTAVFWRDLWSLYHDAPIWNEIPFPGGVPTEEDPHPSAPSQDSGVFVVCKSCGGGKGFAALARATYLNFHHKTFYPAIYRGGFWGNNGTGYQAWGAGDKDTFQIAWMAERDAPYRMMGMVGMVGGVPGRCAATMGQPDETGRTVVLHMNSHKLHYADFKRGFWEQTKRWQRFGFLLRQVYRMTGRLAEHPGDGHINRMVKWAGLQRSGAQRCLSFLNKTEVRVSRLQDEVSYPDLEGNLRRSLTESFRYPWIAEYADPLTPPPSKK